MTFSPLTLIDQLEASRINGFPFFPYSGCRVRQEKVPNGILLYAPKNSGGIKHIRITYDEGKDLYDILFNDNDKVDEVYFDMMVDIIAEKMKIK